jgi:hypothetical protein
VTLRRNIDYVPTFIQSTHLIRLTVLLLVLTPGEGTNCPAEHFRNMRLVINLSFCGSVAGTRYFMDCPQKFKKFKTCNEWVASNPDELKEAYWKIRGVYVYEREWERQWV